MVNEQIEEKMPGGTFGAILALAKIVLTTSGPIALLAIALVIFQGYYVWERLGRIESNQAAIMAQMVQANKTMGSFATLHAEQESQRLELLRTQIRLLQRICLSVTDSSKGLAACIGE